MIQPAGQDLFRKGIDLFKSGKYQEASDIFLQLIEKDDRNHKAWNALGVVYTRTGRYEEADDCYGKALSIAPGTAPYQRNQERNRSNLQPKESPPPARHSEEADEWLEKARKLRDLDSYEESVAAFEEALRINPDDADSWIEKGQILWELTRYEDAVEAFDQALRIDPDNYYVYEHKARILRYELNRPEESIEAYSLAIKNLVSYNTGLYQKGLAYTGLKRYDSRDESLKIFDQAIKNIRLCYTLWHNMGDGLYSLGRFEEAVEAFDQVSRLNMELAWVNYCQGAILSLFPKSEEGPDEAITVFNNAHENFQDVEKTYYLKGLALGRLGRYEEAIAAINQAVRIDPQYADAIRKEE